MAIDEDDVRRRLADLTDDEASYLVFADWLQTENHPLGELIALQRALSETSSESPKRESLTSALADLLKKHSSSSPAWHHGFLQAGRVTTGVDPDQVYRDVKKLMDSSSGLAARRMTSLVIEPLPEELISLRDYDQWEENIAVPWPDLVALRTLIPPHILHLGFGGWPTPPAATAYVQMPDLAKVSHAFPHLRRLELTGHYAYLGAGILGTMRELTDFAIRFATATEGSLITVAQSIANLPKLERLSVWIGGTANCILDDIHAPEDRVVDEFGNDDEDWAPYPRTFRAEDLTAMSAWGVESSLPLDAVTTFLASVPATVKHLAFQGAQLPNGIYRAIALHPRVSQLESLDLSNGCLRDEQISSLLEASSTTLARIRSIDLQNNCLSADAAKMLTSALPTSIKIGTQRVFNPEPRNPRDDQRFFMRYVAGKE